MLNTRLEDFHFSEKDKIEAVCEQVLYISAMYGSFTSIFYHFLVSIRPLSGVIIVKDYFSIFPQGLIQGMDGVASHPP